MKLKRKATSPNSPNGDSRIINTDFDFHCVTGLVSFVKPTNDDGDTDKSICYEKKSLDNLVLVIRHCSPFFSRIATQCNNQIKFKSPPPYSLCFVEAVLFDAICFSLLNPITSLLFPSLMTIKLHSNSEISYLQMTRLILDSRINAFLCPSFPYCWLYLTPSV